MNEEQYIVGKIRSLIKESMQEFEPKIGSGVESGDKKNNKESYKNSEKRAKDYDGGLTDPKKREINKVDDNRTTLDYTFDYDPPKEYKERIKAQAKGYTSKMEEDNKIEKAADFDENGELYDAMKKNAEEAEKAKVTSKKAGIRGQNIPDEAFLKGTMYENRKNMKTLNFKKTTFKNEDHMLSLIPEEYKKEGQSFIMKDKAANEYIVECANNEWTKLCEAKVVKYNNDIKAEEQFSRINELFNYKSADYFNQTTPETRMVENTEKVGQMIEEIRKF
jgi:hypothetical protein